MSECNSDPTGGCNDSALLAEIRQGNIVIGGLLANIDANLDVFIENSEACCTETNAHLENIEGKLDTLIQNAAECCDAITSRLDVIIGLMGANTTTTTMPQVAVREVRWLSHVCSYLPE